MARTGGERSWSCAVQSSCHNLTSRSRDRAKAHGSGTYIAHPTTAASHTPLWLASGWGCLGQRLSRWPRSLDMRCLRPCYRLTWRAPALTVDETSCRSVQSGRLRDDPGSFETLLPLPSLGAPSGKPVRERNLVSGSLRGQPHKKMQPEEIRSLCSGRRG